MKTLPHAQPFFAQPLALLAVAFTLGVLTAHFLSEIPSSLLVISALSSIMGLAALLKHKQVASQVFVIVAFLFAGAILATIEKRSGRADGLKGFLDDGTIGVGDPLELTGVLERQPEQAPGSFYLTLRVEKLRLKGVERNVSGVVNLLLPVYAPVDSEEIDEEYERLELRYGARVRVMTALKRADTFRNPGVSSFTEYLDRMGYDATGVVKSPLLIQRLDDQRVFLPLAWLYSWRQQIQQQINRQFTAETAGVLNAALLGNRYFLSRATAERFREGGTFHVLVISGLHISFIGGLVFLLARRITKSTGWQFLLSTTVLWGYTLAVGAEASVVRAALMFTIVALAPVVARHGGSLNALGAAALVLLIWRPSDLFDPSFQLTFLSVLAIVTFAWPLMHRVSEIGSWRPTRGTPYPPTCAHWLRSVSESLFWSERKWRREQARLTYSYKLFKAPLAQTLERYHLQRFMRYAFGALIVSFCVQLTLLPFLIVYFHRLSMSSLALNIGVSVIMAVLGMTAVAGLMIAAVSADLAAPLISLTNALDWLMVHSVDPFARLGVASLRLPEYSGWGASIYILFYVPLVILAVALSRWSSLRRPEGSQSDQGPAPQPGCPAGDPARASARTGSRGSRGKARVVGLAAVALVIALVIVVAHPLSASRPDGRLRIDFLDVGQGDAALVTMPDGTTLLIDGGGRPGFLNQGGSGVTDEDDEPLFERDSRGIGEAVVSEYLWWRGLDRVDYILATHADADHIDGLNDVARNFSVRAALAARAPATDPEYLKFSKTLSSEGIPVHLLASGDVLRFGAVGASVVWPPAAKNEQAPSLNNDSMVLILRFGERTILLAGDIESDGEAALLRSQQNLQADIVKVAHHGSRTSSTAAFVGTTHPRFAVISVGQTSIFGHPHREVVERWQGTGAEVLTTGQSGMITVTTDGRDLQLETFVQK